MTQFVQNTITLVCKTVANGYGMEATGLIILGVFNLVQERRDEEW